MSGTGKIHVPDGDPARTQKLYVFDSKARSCPDCHSAGPPANGCEHPWHIMGIQPDATLVHQFMRPEGLDWAGGLCELHCREDRCGDRGQRCDCPGHLEDGDHVIQTTIHDGKHGWYAHDGYSLHQHNPVTKSIRWATRNEIERVLQAGHQHPGPGDDAAPCGRWGCVLPAGHNMGQPDIPSNHKSDRQAREGRCPDGGYCHGSTLAAGSSPCEPGHCYRVRTSGPLSGVFPGNRWPPEVTKVLEAVDAKPDGAPLATAIHIAGEVTRHLQAAMGPSAEGGLREAQAELAMATALIESLDECIVQSQHNVSNALHQPPQQPPG